MRWLIEETFFHIKSNLSRKCWSPTRRRRTTSRLTGNGLWSKYGRTQSFSGTLIFAATSARTSWSTATPPGPSSGPPRLSTSSGSPTWICDSSSLCWACFLTTFIHLNKPFFCLNQHPIEQKLLIQQPDLMKLLACIPAGFGLNLLPVTNSQLFRFMPQKVTFRLPKASIKIIFKKKVTESDQNKPGKVAVKSWRFAMRKFRYK